MESASIFYSDLSPNLDRTFKPQDYPPPPRGGGGQELKVRGQLSA